MTSWDIWSNFGTWANRWLPFLETETSYLIHLISTSCDLGIPKLLEPLHHLLTLHFIYHHWFEKCDGQPHCRSIYVYSGVRWYYRTMTCLVAARKDHKRPSHIYIFNRCYSISMNVTCLASRRRPQIAGCFCYQKQSWAWPACLYIVLWHER